MKRTRHRAPPSQKPSTVTLLPEGAVNSTVSSVLGAAPSVAVNLVSQRSHVGTLGRGWSAAGTTPRRADRTKALAVGVMGDAPRRAAQVGDLQQRSTCPDRAER